MQLAATPGLSEGPATDMTRQRLKPMLPALSLCQRELVRLQCYEGLDESKALYEWEYAKQMLYTQLLRDKLSDLLSSAKSLTEAADMLAAAGDRGAISRSRFLPICPARTPSGCGRDRP